MRRTAFAALALASLLPLWTCLAPGGEPVRVEIPPGQGASETARMLEREGAVSSAAAFKALAKLQGADRSLKPGVYALKRRMGAWTALRLIRSGRSEQVKVVIPEGFMASQIAARLQEAGVADAAEFLAYARANRLEGYLFPTTYFFQRGQTAQAVAHHMYEEFKRRVSPEFRRSGHSRFTLGQALTLASIVQREARLEAEMPLIAAVYMRRLEERMRLEADPTVQYALGRDWGEWKKVLTRSDLKTPSEYNTYQYPGLPPGPICSPGLEAVRGVLYPAPTEALYFVADNTGGHVFSRTLDEHNNARIRIRRAAKAR